MSQCPGQDMRKLTVDAYSCPNCGSEIEIFSDEYRRRCPKCQHVVEKDSVPSCANWCAAAKDCLGEVRYKEFLIQKKAQDEAAAAAE